MGKLCTVLAQQQVLGGCPLWLALGLLVLPQGTELAVFVQIT